MEPRTLHSFSALAPGGRRTSSAHKTGVNWRSLHRVCKGFGRTIEALAAGGAGDINTDQLSKYIINSILIIAPTPSPTLSSSSKKTSSVASRP
jgi:hypothetical protein